jgi:DNA-binding MarR family transcriptional regulator
MAIEHHYTPTKNDVKIPIAIITDRRLSAGAFCAYLYLASKPSSFVVTNADVAGYLGVSRGTVTKYWRQLLGAGWISRQVRNASCSGRACYDYELHNEPLEAYSNADLIINPGEIACL